MEIIAHRINSVKELKNVPPEFGCEVDLRDKGNRVILQHDPFKDGEDFEEYLNAYKHGTLILNIKSERIEPQVLDLVKKYKIKKYFFLDSSFPMIFTLVNQGESNIAVRYSEFEMMESVLKMKGKVKWVWVDCFYSLPLDRISFSKIKEAGFKICLVSPELHQRPQDLERYREYLIRERINIDAVCTK